MSGESSEEKTLPATQQKLLKQRKKGNVVTSKETLSSIMAIIAVLYLFLRREALAEKFNALFVLEPTRQDQTFQLLLQDKTAIVWQLGLEVVAPLIALIIALSIFLGMLIAGGPLFAPELIQPKFEKVNPASGFKRIFNRKAFVTFLMHLVRLSLLGGVFTLVLIGGWSALIRSPLCGFGCTIEALEAATMPIVAAAAVVMITMALADYLVQRFEFMREQKMSITEFRRELKDQEGDPHIKGKRQQDQRDMVESPTGASLATIIIEGSGGRAWAVRYVEDDTPAPIVVARARGGAAQRRVMKAADVPSVLDTELGDMLSKKGVGDYITEDEAIELLGPHLQRAISGSPI